mmetsp:Transcript_12141/g.38699  ORF Transcript_12141/g.38699 Transcript_12141/m.38699 type:complete len:249 (+) Transcript_12141:111-857(+)
MLWLLPVAVASADTSTRQLAPSPALFATSSFLNASTTAALHETIQHECTFEPAGSAGRFACLVPMTASAILNAVVDGFSRLWGINLKNVTQLVAVKFMPGCDTYPLHMDHANLTGVLYLNSAEAGAGGEIHFPAADVRVVPKAGQFLTWRSFTEGESGQTVPDPAALHTVSPLAASAAEPRFTLQMEALLDDPTAVPRLPAVGAANALQRALMFAPTPGRLGAVLELRTQLSPTEVGWLLNKTKVRAR